MAPLNIRCGEAGHPVPSQLLVAANVTVPTVVVAADGGSSLRLFLSRPRWGWPRE